MRIVWSPRALEDLSSIHAWLASEHPRAANAILATIRTSVAHLQVFPRAGRPLPGTGVRMWVAAGTAYVVDYRVVADEVQIIAVTHGARRR